MFQNTTDNSTYNVDPNLNGLNNSIYVTICVILSFTTSVGITANILVVYVFIQQKKLQTPLNYVVLTIVISDFVLALLGIPMVAVSSLFNRWIFGEIGCQFYAFISTFVGFVSMVLLATISVYRYIVMVKSHLKYLISYRTVMASVLGGTLYSFVWAFLPLTGWGSFGFEAANTSCSVSWKLKDLNNISYNMAIMVAVLLIPSLIMCACYSLIFMKIRQDSLKRRWRLFRRSCGRTSRMEKEITKTIIYMIVAFFISWFPYAFVCLWTIFGDPRDIPEAVSIIPTIMAKMSVIWNSLIYIARNKQFRNAIRDNFPCLKISILYDQTNHSLRAFRIVPRKAVGDNIIDNAHAQTSNLLIQEDVLEGSKEVTDNDELGCDLSEYRFQSNDNKEKVMIHSEMVQYSKCPDTVLCES